TENRCRAYQCRHAQTARRAASCAEHGGGSGTLLPGSRRSPQHPAGHGDEPSGTRARQTRDAAEPGRAEPALRIPLRHTMSTIDDALLSAYLDGELSGSDLAVVEAALANEPAVGKRLATLKRVNELMRGHARSIDAIPLPAQIRALVESAPSRIHASEPPAPLLPAPVAKAVPFYRRPAQWLPLAASVVLALGLGFGTLLKEQAAENAEGALQDAHASLLQTLPSGSTYQGDGFRLTPQFSFINQE